MLIWLLAIVIFGVLGVTSYYKGAIRSSVSLVGLLCALFLSLPLAPPLRPLVAKVGLTNPFWTWTLPPLTVFLLLVLIFGGVSFFVHHKVALHFKYATDDFTRLRWERLNRRLGVGVGLVAGGIYCLLVGLLVYIGGYLAVQVSTDDSPAVIRYLSDARKQMAESGLDRTLASLDPFTKHSDNFYQACDVVGMVYQNGAQLQDRLNNYPDFLALSERQEFVDVTTDVDLQSMLQTKAPFLNIFNHPKIQAIVNNAEIVGQLQQIDLKDLLHYLKTGKSAKYDEETILGRWHLDPGATLTLERKKNPDMSAGEMTLKKMLITVFMANLTFMATPDNKLVMKVELGDEAKKMVEAAKAVLAPPPPAGEESAPSPTISREYYQRYRMGPRAPTPPPAPTPQQPTTVPNTPQAKQAQALLAMAAGANLTSQGSWERVGDKYKLKLQPEKGGEQSADATADEEKLQISSRGFTLVFVR